MSLSDQERAALRQACSHYLHGFKETDPAQTLRLAANWCELNAPIHDVYGGGKLIDDFETKVAALLGKEAAAFMPTGVMAQLIAMRIWTEQHGIDRFGLHATSHLLGHEEQAFEAVFKLHGVVIGEAQRPITLADLERVREPLAAVIVELPMREVGGTLPTWKELDAIKQHAATEEISLHMDGARLWETRAYYQRSYADIAAGFDSVYVSLYKGIGGLAGAMLAGDSAFVANARVWRKRMGGTLPRVSPMIATAAMRFDDRLSTLDACYQRTLSLATTLAAIPGIKVMPHMPQCNMVHLFFAMPKETLLDQRDAIASELGVWLFGHARDADVPGFSRTELYIGDDALEIDDARLKTTFELLMTMSAKV